MVLVIASLLGLLISILAIITLIPQTPSYPDWMSEMMRRMMGGEIPQQPTTLPFYAFLIPFTFTVLVIVGLVGLLYSFTYPEIKKVKEEPTLGPQALSTQSVQAVMKTLKPDELKVLEILRSHEGKYLQKYISKEAGLSRLKTHRIVARLAERGIVSVREYGNTNEVALADWLLHEAEQEKDQ